MAPISLIALLLALLVHETPACTDAVYTCFKPYFDFTHTDVPNFCDYAGNGGEECLFEKKAQLDSSNLNKRLVQCHRLNPTDKHVAHLTWRYLAYCYYNKPADAVFPECFKTIREKCNKPSSAECKTACEQQFKAVDEEIEFKTSEKEDEEKSSDGAVVTYSALAAVLTFLMAY
uniref:Uncharacterized protein n=1 Tax=Panagrellus redivivus TaxID=6233 RepID=A0A7E4VNL7_PANRE